MKASQMSHFSTLHFGINCFEKVPALIQEEYRNSIFFILVDTNTRKYCLDVLIKELNESFSYQIIEIQPGEENKTLKSCEEIWKQLSTAGVNKESVLVSLGGGMIGDLGGFCAATILRGIRHIQIPTSLLAMVDASAGGKTGTNFLGLKNQIGTFTHPVAIYIHPPFLKTLPERDFNSGFAEIVKHALIADLEMWGSISKKQNAKSMDLDQWIQRSIEIKNAFVELDEKDLNERHALNFGHTIGHAIESYSLANHKNKIHHGEAVVLGMIAEVYLSEEILKLPVLELQEIVSFLARKYNYLKMDFDAEDLLKFIVVDKKNINGVPNFSLIPSIGSVHVNQSASTQQIINSISKAKGHFMSLH